MSPTHVFHRHLKTDYPVAVSGQGIYFTDSTGKTYLDGCGGAAVSCLGHGHPRIIEAIKAQAEKLAYAHTSFFTNEPAEELADKLIAAAPEGFSKTYFVSGGSEANEAALKLARQVHYERGEIGRDHFIARKQSYHGNTLGALSVGYNPGRRKAFEAILLPNVSHISPVYAYRHQGSREDDQAYGLRTAQELEQEIKNVGPDKVVAFIAETVVGATMGCVPPAPGYFKEIRRICDQYGVFMILDEVMSGMGRTGYLFACQEDGVVPDMITCAKGLGGGYQPIGAVLVRDELVETLDQGTGFFHHGHTYIGHAIACAAAIEVQNVIEEDNLLENVQTRGQELRALLEEKFGQHPHIGNIRGRGLFLGLELVKDRETKDPFPSSAKLAARIKAKSMEYGLMCYPGSGTADGVLGDHIQLAPPFIISSAELEDLVQRLENSLTAVFKDMQV